MTSSATARTVCHGRHPGNASARAADDLATLAPDRVAARVMTSGSTGEPQPHRKTWGLLWRNAHAGAARLAELAGLDSLGGVNLVATVPAQHMYGFESSLLVALLAGAAFDAARPFYPADIATRAGALAAPAHAGHDAAALEDLARFGREPARRWP